jgi:glycosyltransferase involved in cell wall biosynthesis
MTYSPDQCDVSVVLPVYNEKGHLRAEIDRVRAALTASRFSFEIIVVDDGSSDGSEKELPTIPDITLIRHRQNQGSGSARRTGTTAARGRIVVWTDVDMTYPNDLIPELVEAMDGYDHIVGWRQSEEGTLKFLRTPAKWIIRKLASYLSETDIKDLNSGLRAFRRDVAMQYVHELPKGFSCVTTLTMSFLGNGYKIAFFPTCRKFKVSLVERYAPIYSASCSNDLVVQPAEGVPAPWSRTAFTRFDQTRV